MRLFALGVVWVVAAVLFSAFAADFMRTHSDRAYAISAADYYADGPRRIAYDGAVAANCATFGQQTGIHDYRDTRGNFQTATYTTACNSMPRAIVAASLMSAIIVAPVVALLAVRIRRRRARG